MKNKNINLKKYLSTPHKIITSKEALKDVIPVKWDDIKKKRKNN